MIRSRGILAEIQLFRLRIAVTGIFLVRCLLTKHSLFQANIPFMNLVSKQIHHQNDGILLASS